MNKNNYGKLLWSIAYLATACLSCWATCESLHLLLPNYPIAFCWVITITFFLIASFGAKLITDSLSNNLSFEKNRNAKLATGIVLLLIFWLMCSMPTNTHTFFFRNLVDDRVNTDVTTTMSYLAQIRDNTVTENAIQEKQNEVENDILLKLRNLESELSNMANPGNGPAVKNILGDISSTLMTNLQPLSGNDRTVQQRQRLILSYRKMIHESLEARKEQIRLSMLKNNDEARKMAATCHKNLNVILETKPDLTDADVIADVCNRLNAGYSCIKSSEQYVHFTNDTDRAAYTCDNPENKVKRLLSVYDVWADFITGKAGGLSFIFWIFISILLDIASFVAFSNATRKQSITSNFI